jgi:hypothetical protein
VVHVGLYFVPLVRVCSQQAFRFLGDSRFAGLGVCQKGGGLGLRFLLEVAGCGLGVGQGSFGFGQGCLGSGQLRSVLGVQGSPLFRRRAVHL